MKQTRLVAGIILAAGGSERMGQPKLLLPLHGKTLLEYVANAALAAGLAPVVVVTGAYAREVRAALVALPVLFSHNPGWKKGQSTSVRAGILALPPEVDAVVMLLGDQPNVTSGIIQELVRVYSSTNPNPTILIPKFEGRSGNPVLFDHQVFPKMLNLSGDSGARQLFNQFVCQFMPVNDPSLFTDVDNPEDYAQLIKEKPSLS